MCGLALLKFLEVGVSVQSAVVFLNQFCSRVHIVTEDVIEQNGFINGSHILLH